LNFIYPFNDCCRQSEYTSKAGMDELLRFWILWNSGEGADVKHNSINNWIKSFAVNAQKLKPIFIMHNVYSWKNWNVPTHS